MPFLRTCACRAAFVCGLWLVVWGVMPAPAADLRRKAGLTHFAGLPASEQPEKATAFSRGLAALRARDYAEALVQFEGAAAAVRIHATPQCWLSARFQVCHVLNLMGRRSDAIKRAREVVVECEDALGAEDPITCESLSCLAFLLKHTGSLAGAEPVYARNLAVLVDKYGDDSLFTATARTRLADLLMLLGRLPEAEAHYRKALAAAHASLGEGHVGSCFFITHLAYCLHALRKKSEATQLMDKAFRMLQDKSSLEASNLGSILRRQAEFYRDIRQLDKARLTGRLCLSDLASKDEIHRDRFYYYDKVRDLYQSILVAEGLNPDEIEAHLAEVESQAHEVR